MAATVVAGGRGAGHWPCIEQPEAVAAAVAEFADRLDPPSRCATPERDRRRAWIVDTARSST